MTREISFGQNCLSIVDRFGIWLSCRAIMHELTAGGGGDVSNPLYTQSILELGCGFHGKNLISISHMATDIVAVDFQLSDGVKSHPKITGIEATIEQALPLLKGRTFNIILLISILEHLNDPLLILQTCYNMLTPNGILLINVPTWIGKIFLEFSAFKLGFSPKLEMDDHKMYYKKSDLWPLVVKSGFKPSKIKMSYHKFRLNLFVRAKK